MDPFIDHDGNRSAADYHREAWQDRQPEPTEADWREYEAWLDEQERLYGPPPF